MKRNINTEKHTETHRNATKDARKTRPHRAYVPIMRCTKAQRGGEPTNRRLNGTGGGGAPHGAKRPHLRIIVYISNKGREDQPLNQYG